MALSENIGYSPDAKGLSLGQGVTGIDYQNAQGACIQISGSPLSRSQGFLDASIVSNSDDLAKALDVDVKASAGYLGSSVKAEFKMDEEFSQSTSTKDIVVRAVQELDGEQLAMSPVWTPVYQALFDSGDFVKLRDRCGDRYVKEVYKDARLYAIIHINKSATQYHIDTSTSGSASFNGSVSSASASLGINQGFKQAVASGSISVTVIAEGLGGGFKDMAQFVDLTNPTSVEDISTRLKNALTAITAVGQPVGYNIVPYPGVPGPSPLDDSTARYLGSVKQVYQRLQGEVSNVECLLTGCDPRSTILSAGDIAALTTYRPTIVAARDSAIRVFSECAANYAKVFGSCAALPPSLPIPPNVYALIPEVGPDFLGAMVVLDGSIALDPGQSSSILADGYPTLLDSARALYPGTQTVDAYALIVSPYFASLSTEPSSFWSQFGGSTSFSLSRPQLVYSVPGFNGEDKLVYGGVLIFHADSLHSCPKESSPSVAGVGAFNTWSSLCLSPFAAHVMDVIERAAHDSMHPICQKGGPPAAMAAIGGQPDPLFAILLDRFGKSNRQQIGQILIRYDWNNGACDLISSAAFRTAAGGQLILGIRKSSSK